MPLQPEELIAVNMAANSTQASREAIHLALASEVLQSFGELRFVARGGSMLPSILPGDTLLVRRQPVASIRPGQVALCRRAGAFCAHRVKFKTHCDGQWLLSTGGDALAGEDSPIFEEDVLGRVFAVVRWGKYIDLTESRGLGIRVIEWAVKRSDVFSSLLLRCHAFRLRVAGRTGNARSRAERRLTECL
jgi:Peptidase S24-like